MGRVFVTAILLLAILTLSGCAETETESRPADERRQVQERVAAYTRAYLGGDGRAACAAYTPAFRADAERRARGQGWRSCAQLLGTLGPKLLEVLPAEQRRRALPTLGDPREVMVEIQGGRASAGYDPRRAGALVRRVALERVDGRWMISALGVSSGSAPGA